MGSAARKRAAARVKSKAAAAERKAASTSEPKVHVVLETGIEFINAHGKKAYITEATFPSAWPFPELKKKTVVDRYGDEQEILGGWVTVRGQSIRQSLAQIFAAEVRHVDFDVDYTQRDHNLHTAWKQYNSGVPAIYKPTTVPLNLRPEQQAKIAEIDAGKGATRFSIVNHTSDADLEEQKKRSYGKAECAFWPQGQCMKGDACRFLHPPEKAPKMKY